MVGCWKDERMRVGKRLKLTLQDFWTTRCRLPWRGMISFDKIYELKESSMFSWIILEHVVRASFSQYRVSFSKLCLLYMWRFHSWVAIRNPALMIWHPCQNAKMSGFLTDKNSSVNRTWQKKTLPRYQHYESRGIHDIVFTKWYPGRMHWTNQSGDPSVWHPESHTPRPLPRGGQLQLGDQCLCKKRERMAISHDLIAGDTCGRGGLVGFEGLGC